MPPLTSNQNPHFQLLAAALERATGIDGQSLLDALFLLRAPWSLQAIVPCCRHLLRLGRQLPEVLDPPISDDQNRQLEVVEAIASLGDSGLPRAFFEVHVVRRADGGAGLERPIYGYSGDSGLAELLVMRPPEQDEETSPAAEEDLFAAVDPPMSVHERAFVFLRGWFARQTFAYQARCMPRLEYDAYLLGNGTDRLNQGPGSRLYAASLAIRHLGSKSSRAHAVRLALAIGSLDDARTRFLARVFEHLGDGGLKVGDIPAHVDPFLASLLPGVNLTATVRSDKAHATRMASLARWVRLVWGRDEVRERSGSGRRSVRRGNIQIDIYPDALARIEQVSLGNAGLARRVEIFRQTESGELPLETVADVDCQDDPEDEVGGEALVEIYLADGDPVQAYYASKAQVHHIERANAMLRWPPSRMSVAVTRAVADCVASVSRAPSRSIVRDRAWLSIGLALLTGRVVADASVVSMHGTKESSERLAIDLATHTLVAPVPRPDLRGFEWARDPFPKYCTPWAPTVRLPLPEAWWPLVDRLAGKTERADKAVMRQVVHLIAEMPDAWHVTAAGIYGALRLAVQDDGQDDLALIKVMTDAETANARNLIHYASYPREAVEERWRRIVQAWVGPLPAHTLRPDRPGERVGSPYGIDATKVKESIDEVRRRFEVSVAKGQWPAVYNQLTLYTAMWLGLATAGRRACQPVPQVVLSDGWALVRDKSRPDESTDRYVPLTPALRQQIVALRALTHALSLAEPDLVLPKPGDEHALVLYTIVEQRGRHGAKRLVVKPFQPKYTDRTVVLRDLPGNWGRKLVRSGIPPPGLLHPEAVELGGRFKDAGLGHWTQGRHPWTTSSAFPAGRFREQWLAMQDAWERELGFEVLGVSGLDTSAYEPPEMLPPSPPSLRKKLADRYHEAQLSDAAVEAMLRKGGSAQVVEAGIGRPTATSGTAGAEVFTADTAAPAVKGLQLANQTTTSDPEAMQRLIQDILIAHAKKPREKVRALARRLCRYARAHHHVNLFVSEPHRRFTRSWLVNNYEFGCLAYAESTLLPGIARDLAHLPARDGSPAGVAADLGRLLVALAWRGGVLSTSHLDAAMAYLAGVVRRRAGPGAKSSAPADRRDDDGVEQNAAVEEEADDNGAVTFDSPTPVYAVGDLRLLELRRVSTRRSAASIARSVLLEPYLAALVTVERTALADPLRDAFTRTASHRAHYWNRVFHAYLGTLNLPRTISLPAFLGALRQRLMLRSSPVLAAYASGEIMAYDLPAKLFCQLAGVAAPAAGTARAVAPSDTREPLQGGKGLPRDMRTSFTEFGKRITDLDSSRVVQWDARVSHFKRLATEPEQRLLCEFVRRQIRYYYEQGPRNGLQSKQRTTLRENTAVVWEGLVHAHFAWGPCYIIDESALEAMALATEDMFSVRRHHGAWAAFRMFLQRKEALQAGMVIRGVDAKGALTVNSRILSRSDLDGIGMALGSVRSGIATQANRQSARRHFALTRAYGTRRAEAEALRWQDVDGEIIRIQAYGDHTLKTPAAERILPSAYLPPQLWETLQEIRIAGVEKVIDSEPGAAANGDNFFPATAAVMKKVTGDMNMSHHPVRHTVASALVLKLIGKSVDLARLDHDLPWVAPLLPEDDQVAVLIGPGGEGGQGLKAVAALLGHLHETTTLYHYVHTLGIALYADALSLPHIPLHVAFQHRASGRATLFRRNKKAEEEAWTVDRTDRCLRDTIEQGVLRRASSGSSLIMWPGGPRPPAGWGVDCSPEADAWLGKVEQWTNQLFGTDGRPAKSPIDGDLGAVRHALRKLADVPSGKRGSSLRRHVFAATAADGTPMVEMPGGAELLRAAALVTWLLRCKGRTPDDYVWLLKKWATASAQCDGSMRLDGDPDRNRAQRITGTMGEDMNLVVEPVRLSRARAARSRHLRHGKPPQYRMRIRFTREIADRDDKRGESQPEVGPSQRGLQAVRWALSWAWVEREVQTAQGPQPA